MLIEFIMLSLLVFCGGITVFLWSVGLFSGSLKKGLGGKVQALFEGVGDNRWICFGLGAGATAVVQSSTATTLMAVGLVNAGILTLFQASAIIIGANVGTTTTGLLVSLSVFNFKYIFMALVVIGLVVRVFAKNERTVLLSGFLIGFGGVFVGLELIGSAFLSNQGFRGLFAGLFENVTFPLLLILIGAAFTGIIQSSGASMAIYINMIIAGVLSFESAVFLAMGSEIGTCLTTLLAGSRQGMNAKRAALVHLLFNVFSAILFCVLILPFKSALFEWWGNFIVNPVWRLSVFQVVYNLVGALVLIWFIRPMSRLVERLIKS